MNARLDLRPIDSVNDSKEGYLLQYQQQQQTSSRLTSSSDRSNEVEIDQYRFNDGYHNQHERLRPCKSLDSRITLDPNVRSGTQYLSNSDGGRKLGGRLSLDTPSGQLKRPQNGVFGGGTRLATLAAEQDARFISTPPPNVSTEDMSEDGERRATSARERPQSAWKNRRSGRQPKFTFTDFADSSNDTPADVSTSGGRSHRYDSNSRKQGEEGDAAAVSSPVEPDAAHTYRRAVTSELRHQSRPSTARRQQLRLQRSDEELSVDFGADGNEESISPLPNEVTGSTFDSQRRRHSLYAQLPTKAAAAAYSPRPAAAIGSNDVFSSPDRRRGSFNDDADSSSVGSEDSGENNGGMYTNKEDGVGFRFRNGSLNDCERDARRRVLARLAGSDSHASIDGDYDVIAATKAAAEHVNNGGGLPVRRRLSQAAAVSGRALPPRKLEPLFPTDISGRQN